MNLKITKINGISNFIKSGLALLAIIFLMGINKVNAQSPQTFTSSGTWTCPTGVHSIQVQAWGGGGGAGYAGGLGAASGGGAGGSYSMGTSISVTPGQTYTITVGSGGQGGSLNSAANDGGNSIVIDQNSTIIFTAVGGAHGLDSDDGGAGGVASTSGNSGSTNFAGGNGGAGDPNDFSLGAGGGGGAGDSGNGSVGASDGTYGSGGSNGGNGGSGSAYATGGTGQQPGGGGGGTYDNDNSHPSGGSGGDGQVIITWTACPSFDVLAGISASLVCGSGTSAITVNSFLPDDTYTVTYTDNSGSTTSSMTVSEGNGYGTFTTGSYSSTQTITITNIASTGTNNGCSSSISSGNTATLTVENIPDAPGNISGSTTVCSGSTQTYSIADVDGATSYTWNIPGDWNGTSSTTSVTVTVGTESVAISVTATNDCGTSSASTTGAITVNTAPYSISYTNNPVSYCAGTEITENDASVLGTPTITFNLIDNLPGGFIFDTGTGAITGTPTNASPSADYTVSATNGCGSTTVSVNITVNELPIVGYTGTVTVCNGQTTTLSGTGATSYVWTGGISDGVSFTPSNSGDYNVTGTDGNGCTNTATASVTVNSLPSVSYTGNTTVCQGQSTTLSGTGANSYTWDGGISDGVSFTPPNSGDYNVTGTDGNGCTNTATASVTVNSLPSVSYTGNTTVCQGQSTTLSGTGANSYTWDGGISDGVSFTPSNSGDYNVTGTDGNGCTNTATASVTVNSLPSVSYTGNTTVCQGQSTTLSGTGANSYTWDGGISDGVSFTPPNSGDYNVTGTDGNGCTNTATASVTVNSLPSVSYTGNTTVCQGQSTTLSGTGANSYTWDGGISDGVSFTPSNSGDYNVTGTDGNGCTNTATASVTVNSLPSVSYTGNTTVCQGQSTTLSGTGANSYTWDGGISDGVSFTPSNSGDYNVTGTDGNGCTNTATASVTVNSLPTVSYTGNTTVCQGQSTTLSGTGANSYTWDGGISDGVSFTPSNSGDYNVTGTDGNGCTNTATASVTVNSLPSVSYTGNTTVCQGQSTTLSGTGANSYTWDGGISDGVSFTPPNSGDYNVTGTDGNGCTNTATASVTVNVNPQVTITSPDNLTQTICSGYSISLLNTSINNNPPNTIYWSDSYNDNLSQYDNIDPITVSPSVTTDYFVVHTDENGCSGYAGPFTVTVNTPPSPIISGGPDFCGSGTIDAGTLDPITSVAYSSYVWGDFSNGETLDVILSDTYDVTITDANQCTGTASLSVTVNTPPTPSITGTLSYCESDGSTTLDAGTDPNNNGNPYSNYSWSDGSNAETVSASIGNNDYSVTVTDVNGCSGSATPVTVIQNTNPTPSITGTLAYCASDGSTTLDAGIDPNTSSPYSSYSWSDGSNAETVSASIGNNDYSVTVTDVNGCSGSSTPVTVIQNTNPTPGITGPLSYCASAGSTTLDAGIDPNTSNPYTSYSWSDGSNAETVSASIGNNDYSVTVTDVNGCSGSATPVTVIQNTNPTPSITGTLAYCASDGSTTLDAGIDPNTSSPYSSYSWSDGSNTETVSASIGNNDYSVTVTDVNGCSGSSTPVTVIQNTNPTPGITGPLSYCASAGSTTLDAGIDPNTSNPYTSYSWSDGSNAETVFASISSNDYSVTVTDVNGCSGSSTPVTVVENANPVPEITSTGNVTAICNGGSVQLNNIPNDNSTSVWSNSINQTTVTGDPISVQPNVTTDYFVLHTDNNGCTGTAGPFTITVNQLPIPVITGASPFCVSGVLDAGTTAPNTSVSYQSYHWGDNSTSEFLTVSSTNSYHVTVTDINTCTGTASFAATVNNTPAAPASFTSHPTNICSNSTNNFYSIATVLHATSYTWSVSGTGWSVTSTSSGGTGAEINIGSGAGSVSVTANNACGSSTGLSTGTLTPILPPSTPGSITGNITSDNLCPGTNPVYTIASVSGATSYIWSLPSGWLGTSSTTSISTTAGTNSGNISVTANNVCHTSTASTQAISVNHIPIMPTLITGNTTPCQASFQTYTCPVISNATSYTWTWPSDWASTPTLNAITTIVGTATGNVTVYASNECGTGGTRTLAITSVSPLPVSPGTIHGNTQICSGSTSQTYTVSSVSGATGYVWSIPVGWSGSSTTTSISITSGTSGGVITARAANACGDGPQSSLTVAVNTPPAEPGSVTGNPTPCQSSQQTYTVATVNGASYIWTMPSGWSGTSTINSLICTVGSTTGSVTVKATNGCGTSAARTLAITAINPLPGNPGAITGSNPVCSNTPQTYATGTISGATSYVWSLPSGWSGSSATTSIATTVSGGSGNIVVNGHNTCGSGGTKTLAVTVNTAPVKPGSISGNATPCFGTHQSYTIATVAGANSYTWTLPGGWTGTSTTTTISSTVGSNTGFFVVKANNSCGSSDTSRKNITNVYTVTPVTITGNPQNFNYCSQISPLDVVMTATSGYNAYAWSPNGGTLQSATVNTPATYTVTATNSNGCTTTATKAVTNNCALPTNLANSTLTGTTAKVTWTQSQCAASYTIQKSIHGANSWTTIPNVTGGSYTFTGLTLNTYYDWKIESICSQSQNSGYSAIITFKTNSSRSEEDLLTTSDIPFNIYPNPADALVTFAFSSGDEGAYTIKLIDMFGRIVKSETDNASPGENTHLMNLDGVAKGIYIVILQKGDNISKSKLMVQ